MMTEAVVTPWLSDRDLALQNVRYVMDAAGDLHEDFHPRARRLHRRARPPGARRGDRPARADRRPHRASTALLDAIADGTFGLMKRPADAGQGPRRRGAKARRLLQPGDRDPGGGALTAATSRAIVRPYGDTTGDGMVQLSFTLPMPARQARRGRRGPAGQQDGHGPGAGRARQGDGPGLHVLRRLRPGATTSSTPRRSRSSSATTRCSRPRRSTPRSSARCAAGWWSWAAASAPTPTPSASTRSSTSRGSRGRRAWSTTASSRS